MDKDIQHKVSRTSAFIEEYIYARKSEKGLTAKGERWIRQTLPRFERFVNGKGLSLGDVKKNEIREFLSSINRVWYKHSHFRAIRAFYNWLEREGNISLSPCHGMQPPQLPKRVMPRPTIAEIKKLIEATNSPRNKAIICVFADTGFRLNELASIPPQDINWETQTVQVWGKGAKQRKGRFGDITTRYLREHLAGFSVNGNIWGLSVDGIASMLKRLQRKTGIVCNPHSFRRTWTIETIKNGTNLLDVQILGGWEGLEMVRRYAREVNSEDAISRYKPVLQ
jgi:site-specific recombinase XerD